MQYKYLGELELTKTSIQWIKVGDKLLIKKNPIRCVSWASWFLKTSIKVLKSMLDFIK